MREIARRASTSGAVESGRRGWELVFAVRRTPLMLMRKGMNIERRTFFSGAFVRGSMFDVGCSTFDACPVFDREGQTRREQSGRVGRFSPFPLFPFSLVLHRSGAGEG